MPRGVRVWNRGDSEDLFAGEPPAAPPSPPPAPPAPGRRRYTDQENRRLERVLPLFIAWLGSASIAELEAAETPALMARFAPMQDWDIEQMLGVALGHRRRRPKR